MVGPRIAMALCWGLLSVAGCSQPSTEQAQERPPAMTESPELVAKREQARQEWIVQEQARRREWVQETVGPYRTPDTTPEAQVQRDQQPAAPDAVVTSAEWPAAFKRRCYQLGITRSQFKAIRHPDPQAWPNAFPVFSDEDRAGIYPFSDAGIYDSWREAGVIKAHYFYEHTFVGINMTQISDAGLMLGRVDADTSFYFYPDEDGAEPVLFRIQSRGPSEVFPYVAGLFREAMGEPTAVRTEAVQNRMGASFENQIVEYINDVSLIRISRFADTLDTLQVEYILLPVFGRLAEKLDSIKREEAGKL